MIDDRLARDVLREVAETQHGFVTAQQAAEWRFGSVGNGVLFWAVTVLRDFGNGVPLGW